MVAAGNLSGNQKSPGGIPGSAGRQVMVQLGKHHQPQQERTSQLQATRHTSIRWHPAGMELMASKTKGLRQGDGSFPDIPDLRAQDLANRMQ